MNQKTVSRSSATAHFRVKMISLSRITIVHVLSIYSCLVSSESIVGKIVQLINGSNNTWKADGRFNYEKLNPIYALTGTRVNDPYKLFLSVKHPISVDRVFIPEEFDSRKQWPFCPTIGEIFEQGKCASCWAVAPADVMSDRICIHSGGQQIVRLSAANILSCCRMCGKGCNGGFPAAAWYHWIWKGVVTGSTYSSEYGCQSYPFKSCRRDGPFWKTCPQGGPTPKCVNKCQSTYKREYKDDLYYGKKIYRIANNVQDIQVEIMTNGPVQATLRMYQDFLTYRSGVYQHSQGRGMDYHAVKIIGWGVENGVPYWLATNMWSQDWGERGLFKILRGDNHAEIEMHVLAGIPRLTEAKHKFSSTETYHLNNNVI